MLYFLGTMEHTHKASTHCAGVQRPSHATHSRHSPHLRPPTVRTRRHACPYPGFDQGTHAQGRGQCTLHDEDAAAVQRASAARSTARLQSFTIDIDIEQLQYMRVRKSDL